MKRTIKFRGRDMTGHFVYGLLTKKRSRHSGEISWAIATGIRQSEVIPVNENSIAQLVGFDANGREVYEGDILVDDDGCETPAMLFALQFSGKLKEATT